MDQPNVALQPRIVEAHQYGPVYAGPGALREKPQMAKLTSEQKRKLDVARKFAREQGIKAAYLTQTITQQQKVAANSQNCSQRLQALALMKRIYVGSINFSISEEKVRQSFMPFGTIKSISMPYSQIDDRHKGFAFIEFEAPDAAYLAIEKMNGSKICGFGVTVGRPSNMPQAHEMVERILKEAKGYARIYVTNIDSRLSEKDLKDVFQSCGAIRSVHLANDPLSMSCNKGYAYMEYESQNEAEEACKILDNFDLGGKRVMVRRAVIPPVPENQATPGPSAMPMAAAIAAAAITAEIKELQAKEAVVPVVVVIPQAIPQAVPQVIPQSNTVSPPPTSVNGFHGSPVLPPPSVFIPPASLIPKSGLPETPAGHESASGESPKRESTRVVVLKNMIDADEVDDELESEVGEECNRYGQVAGVLVHVAGSEAKIFVEYENAESTTTAIAALNGRLFGGRIIRAEAYDQRLFDSKDFSK